jgi:hypothetical protein
VAAVSEAEPNRFAVATVTITPAPINAVGISLITPSSVEVKIGGQETFSTQVLNSTNQSVTWQVNGVTGGDSTYGTITLVQNLQNSDEATYIAPAVLPLDTGVIISAIPAANPAISATASVTLEPLGPITVQLSPQTAMVEVGLTQLFTATILNTPDDNQATTWYVRDGQGNYILNGNGTVGTITFANVNDSNKATYTAPAVVPPAPVTVKAASTIDPNAVATAPVTIVANTVVQISPGSAEVNEAPGGNCENSPCTVNFTATVTGLANTNVTWSANGEPGGDPEVNGTIVPDPNNSDAATYSAPAEIANPNAQGQEIVAITALASDGITQGTAQVTVNPVSTPPPPTISFSSSEEKITVPPSGSFNFTAEVNNASPPPLVNWVLSSPLGPCTPALCGTLTATGVGSTTSVTLTAGSQAVYTAPANIPTNPVITITATAEVSPNPQASTTITIAFATASISISPATLTVVAGSGSSTPFTATLQNADPSTVVTWTLGCDSLAPSPFNCGDFLSAGEAGPGCITDGTITDCSDTSQPPEDSSTVPISYTPPKELGGNFQNNACSPTQGVANGLVPLTASINVNNCVGNSCQQTVCITVTPP